MFESVEIFLKLSLGLLFISLTNILIYKFVFLIVCMLIILASANILTNVKF